MQTTAIRDMDMAEKLMELIKVSILTEAGVAILAQANVSTAGVILLLREN